MACGATCCVAGVGCDPVTCGCDSTTVPTESLPIAIVSTALPPSSITTPAPQQAAAGRQGVDTTTTPGPHGSQHTGQVGAGQAATATVRQCLAWRERQQACAGPPSIETVISPTRNGRRQRRTEHLMRREERATKTSAKAWLTPGPESIGRGRLAHLSSPAGGSATIAGAARATGSERRRGASTPPPP